VGATVPIGDVEAMADAMARIAMDETHWKTMG
jgi:hypothetical protein